HAVAGGGAGSLQRGRHRRRHHHREIERQPEDGDERTKQRKSAFEPTQRLAGDRTCRPGATRLDLMWQRWTASGRGRGLRPRLLNRDLARTPLARSATAASPTAVWLIAWRLGLSSSNRRSSKPCSRRRQRKQWLRSRAWPLTARVQPVSASAEWLPK